MKKAKHIIFCTLCALCLMGLTHLAAQPTTPTEQSKNTKEMNEIKEASLPAICRIWHGWTTLDNADKFENLLEEVIGEFEKNRPRGYRGIQLLRRELNDHTVEFTTHMWFDTIESVKSFAGKDYETAHIDERVKPLLLRYDSKSIHSFVKTSTY